MIKLAKEQLLDGARSLAVEKLSMWQDGDCSGLKVTPPTADKGGWHFATIRTTDDGEEYESCYGDLSDSEVVIRALVLAALS